MDVQPHEKNQPQNSTLSSDQADLLSCITLGMHQRDSQKHVEWLSKFVVSMDV